MGVSDQCHALAALGKGPQKPHWIGGWVGPRVSLDAHATRKILCPVGTCSIHSSPMVHS
jgi:hypothetical protein